MKQTWKTFSLLLLTLSLLLTNRVEARPGRLSVQEVITEVNNLRAEKGLAPYQVNSTLMSIAQTQADYMAGSGVITHFGADGSRPYQRAIAAGYSVAGDLSLGGFFSENIHAGAGLTPAQVVVIWQGDADHLKTMTSSDLTDMGAGVATQNGLTYYVLDVGASTGTPTTNLSPESPVIFTPTSGTPAAPIITSTPLEDGSVYHVVQPNEALWSIALAYGLTIDELKRKNQLQSNNIFVGQKLLISKMDLATSTLEPTITVTIGIPTSTVTRPVTPTTTSTPTPLPTPPASRQNGIKIVGGIIIAAIIAAGLGAWLGRRKAPEI